MVDSLPHELARVQDYAGLVMALREIAQQLGIPYSVIEKIAGVAHIDYLLAPRRGRGSKSLGYSTLGPVLCALGVEIVLVANEAQREALRRRHDWRQDEWPEKRREFENSGENMRARKRPRGGLKGKANPLHGNSAWGRQMRMRQIVMAKPGYVKRQATGAARKRWSGRGKPRASPP